VASGFREKAALRNFQAHAVLPRDAPMDLLDLLKNLQLRTVCAQKYFPVNSGQIRCFKIIFVIHRNKVVPCQDYPLADNKSMNRL
jgi:hypothetical protein